MTTSIDVLSPAYKGLHSLSVSPKISPEDIKSMEGGQPNVASYPYGEYKVRFEKGAYGESYAVTRTANKTYRTLLTDFFKNGSITQQDDYEIEGMKQAGEDVRPNMFDRIPKMPNFMYIIGPNSLLHLTNPRDTQVDLSSHEEIANAVDPNKVGFYYSKIPDGLIREITTPEAKYYDIAVEWVNYLAKKGYNIDKSPSPGVTGLGTQEGDFYAAYYHRQGSLVVPPDFFKKSEKLISRYGLTEREAIEAMEVAILLHEFGHVVGIKGYTISERNQGLFQAEFCSMMAERYRGTKKEKIFRALAREGSDYAKGYSFYNKFLESLVEGFDIEPSKLKELRNKFVIEAIERGEDIEPYVDMRLEETVGRILKDEPSYKGSNLEEIVKNNKVSKSEYKSMRDVEQNLEKGKEADKAESKEPLDDAPEEAQTAETAENSSE